MMTPETIVKDEIYANQTLLVEELLNTEVFSFEDIVNLFDEDDNPQEVFSWYSCSDWLCDKMRDMGYPVIDNDYGKWYGRTTFGQMIAMDYNIRHLAGFEE